VRLDEARNPLPQLVAPALLALGDERRRPRVAVPKNLSVIVLASLAGFGSRRAKPGSAAA